MTKFTTKRDGGWSLRFGKYRCRTSPDSIDYSLSLISPEGERVVGYDNHWPKGHHCHVLAEEGPYTYSGIDALIADFKADVLRVRRKRS
jgi:hypothetical protein